MLITMRPARYLDDRLVGPIVAFDDAGYRLAEADALSVAGCSAIRTLFKSAACPTEFGASLTSVTSTIALLMNQYELPFIPFGKDHRFGQEAARLVGFTEQTAAVQMRNETWRYKAAPAGALVPDVTTGLPLAAEALRLIAEEALDIPLFRQRWVQATLRQWAADGLPFPDPLGEPKLLN